MDQLSLLEKAANTLGRARAAYDLPLLKALQVDGIGRTLPMSGFTMMGASGPSFINFDQTLSRDQYQGVVYLIISSILRKANDIPWGVFKPGANDERAELVKKGHPLNDLMWRPNPRESWADLIESLGGYLLLRGNSYGFGVLPLAGSKKGQVQELYCMPADKTAPVETKDWLNPVDGYTMKQHDGSVKKYESEAVMHVKYWNPDSAVLGLSPLQAMAKMVTLADSGLNAQVRQQQNQGPAGVLFDKSSTEPWTVQQTSKVQAAFRSFWGGGRQQGELPIVGGELGFVKLGLSTADLDVLEALQVTTRQLCSGFGYPAELLNDKEASTYNNVSEARKAALTDAVLPLLRRLRDGINRFVGPGFKDEVFFDIITDNIPELQDDRKAQADMLSTAWWIPVQRKQAIMGERPDDTLPTYLFPLGLQTQEDLASVPPIGDDADPGATLN
jgi:HK97 family phage portal protein